VFQAGFDYVALDITNWPQTGPFGPEHFPSTDMTIMRPFEVLLEEWMALRAKGLGQTSLTSLSWMDHW